MAEYVITVPYWRPATLNKLMSMHWIQARKLKKADSDIVDFYAGDVGAKGAECKRRVDLHITYQTKKDAKNKAMSVCDPDAFWKSLLDALVNCGALYDDSPKWVELGDVTQVKGVITETRITLTDIREAADE